MAPSAQFVAPSGLNIWWVAIQGRRAARLPLATFFCRSAAPLPLTRLRFLLRFAYVS